jgi:hypothetical protein
MKLLGLPLQRPTFNGLTGAAVLATGLWLLLVGLMHGTGQALGALDAGAALVVVAWSCIAVQCGIHVGRGLRHLAANLLVSALLLAVYEVAVSTLLAT